MVELDKLTQTYEAVLVKRETGIFGLKYAPSLEPMLSDSEDRHFDHTQIQPPGGMFSYANAAAVRSVLTMLRPLRAILEIGCYSPSHREHSSTDCLCENKPDDCWYFGVDINDNGRRKRIDDWEKRRIFIQVDSIRRLYVNAKMCLQLCGQIDLLLIDGHHSTTQVALDWRYANYVRPGGIILMHDINYHAGPRLVFDAVDPKLFRKVSLCPEKSDFGLGMLIRKETP